MKKCIGVLIAGMMFLAMSSFAIASEDKVNIKVYFLYPNGDVIEQTHIVTETGSVDFTEDDLSICNDLLYLIGDLLPDFMSGRQMHMLDLAQGHVDAFNLNNDILEIKKANIILRHILDELNGG